jgi:hypothetical protein
MTAADASAQLPYRSACPRPAFQSLTLASSAYRRPTGSRALARTHPRFAGRSAPWRSRRRARLRMAVSGMSRRRASALSDNAREHEHVAASLASPQASTGGHARARRLSSLGVIGRATRSGRPVGPAISEITMTPEVAPGRRAARSRRTGLRSSSARGVKRFPPLVLPARCS